MTWSTRELARLAGTTLKTVRYYHRIGLLDEPERAANGYKRYQITHLIRLLRIRRLVDLGVPLSDIAAMEESDEHTEQTLRALDAELAASIERQQRMREELAVILRHQSPIDLPPGFDGVGADLSDADRSMLLICSRVFDSSAMTALREMLSVPRTAVEKEFDALPADASEDTRQDLAERFAPVVRQHYRAHPVLKDSTGEPFASPVVVQGLVEFYNPAQLDVLQRANVILEADPD